MDGTPGLQSGTFAGRYTVERELGRGATATVYLARDTQRGHAVAIKLLRPELAESLGAERFLKEIKLSERLHHPHIASVLDSGEVDGQLYFVLPHMEGGSMRQLLQREKQLSVETAVSITKTVALALDYAHTQGLIHRDVKPENILFTSGQACLADFGIARAVERAIDESTTSTGLVRGTPAYMSPEQASGSRTYDGRSDQYSLACVLYEMLAGVPAFIGATPEAVIAMRFQHQPRDLSVYRPSVSPAIQAVVARALSLLPADRYATLGEFANALDSALRAPIVESRTSGSSVGFASQRRVALVGAAIFVVAALGTGTYLVIPRITDRQSSADTSKVVVLPFAVQGPRPTESQPQEMFVTALRRWNGLAVVPVDETAQAIRRETSDSALTTESARKVASALGAGRFVTGRVSQLPTGAFISAEYRDIKGEVLYTSQVALPVSAGQLSEAYAALADSLLLRGRSDGSRVPARAPRNLPATQLMIRALAARDEWDLELADSLFTAATAIDPSYSRAFLWLAQTRSWTVEQNDQWASAAERAARDSVSLSADERLMTSALISLLQGRFSAACAAYRSLRQMDAASFVAWYGLGECQRRDSVVIADPSSPSGWRFRTSYERELSAYTRAFELLPVSYRGFQTGGYNSLRQLLLTSGRTLRRGESGDGRRFLARTRLLGDTLALVPFDMTLVLSGDRRASADPRAIARTRTTFRYIASRWSSAFPTSPAVKEAVAISLQLAGDRAALDTIAAAERLATDPLQRLRLATTRVVLQVQFGVPENLSDLRAAQRSADSLLQSRQRVTQSEAALLAPMAALVGRCAQTQALLRDAATVINTGSLRLPTDVVGDAAAVQSAVVLGCAGSSRSAAFDSIASRIPLPAGSGSARIGAEYLLLGAAVASTFPLDERWVRRLSVFGDYLLLAERSVLDDSAASARATLMRVMRNRQLALPGEVAPDAVLPEALLLLQLGDTAGAVSMLDRTLTEARNFEPLRPSETRNNVARIGSLIRGMVLRAQLAALTDHAAAARWSAAVAALWSDADDELKPITRSMTELSKLH